MGMGTGPDRTGPYWTGRDGTQWDAMGRDGTGRDGMGWDGPSVMLACASSCACVHMLVCVCGQGFYGPAADEDGVNERRQRRHRDVVAVRQAGGRLPDVHTLRDHLTRARTLGLPERKASSSPVQSADLFLATFGARRQRTPRDRSDREGGIENFSGEARL